MDESDRFLEFTQLCEWNAPFPDISYAVFSGFLQISAQCHLISKAFPVLLKIATCPPTPTSATNSHLPFLGGPCRMLYKAGANDHRTPVQPCVLASVTICYILHPPCLFIFLSEGRGFCLVISKCLKQCWPHSRCSINIYE